MSHHLAQCMAWHLCLGWCQRLAVADGLAVVGHSQHGLLCRLGYDIRYNLHVSHCLQLGLCHRPFATAMHHGAPFRSRLCLVCCKALMHGLLPSPHTFAVARVIVVSEIPEVHSAVSEGLFFSLGGSADFILVVS